MEKKIKAVQVPFSEKETEAISILCKARHLKKSTLIASMLAVELHKFRKNNGEPEILMSFDGRRNRLDSRIYAMIYVDTLIYEDLERLSVITFISIPFLIRYFICPKLVDKEAKEGA